MRKLYMIGLVILSLLACRSEKEQCMDKLRETEFIPFCPAYAGLQSIGGTSAEAQAIDNSVLLLCVQNLAARAKCDAESTNPEFEPLEP